MKGKYIQYLPSLLKHWHCIQTSNILVPGSKNRLLVVALANSVFNSADDILAKDSGELLYKASVHLRADSRPSSAENEYT